LNKFRKLGLIEYNGDLKVNPSLLTVSCTTDHRWPAAQRRSRQDCRLAAESACQSGIGI